MTDRQATFWIGDALEQAGRDNGAFFFSSFCSLCALLTISLGFDHFFRSLDLVEEVKILARLNVDFTTEERNLFSVAFKNLIGSKRAAWRVLSSIRSENEGNTYLHKKKTQPYHSLTGHLNLIKNYKKKIEEEMVDVCNEVFSILDSNLIPNAGSDENKVYWHKM